LNQNMKKHIPLIIAGPTASGKTSYALEMAKKLGGAIINADSMQIYKELPILTAQPDYLDLTVAPHRLYGVLAGDDMCSAARWRELALKEIQWCRENDLKPILVGGTGLYLLALTKGLSEIPGTEPAIRTTARNLLLELGVDGFYNALIGIDPLIEGALNPADSQRLVRAYEVMVSTGKSITQWQKNPPLEPGIDAAMVVIDRPRAELHQRASGRFDVMMEKGALDEVEQLMAKNYDKDLPVMRALGVAELSAHLKGEISLDEARELTVIATRQYIKRQSTFFRNQFPDAQRLVIC